MAWFLLPTSKEEKKTWEGPQRGKILRISLTKYNMVALLRLRIGFEQSNWKKEKKATRQM